MKFKKRPIVIEAEQFIPDNPKPGAMFMQFPIQFEPTPESRVFLIIPTLEGFHRAEIGDWVIKGIKGEFYPCKPDIFEATYELADKDSP